MRILHQICYTYLYWQGSRGSHCTGRHEDPTIRYTYLYWQGSRGSRCRGTHGDPPPDPLYIPVLTGKQGISLYGKTWGSYTRSAIRTCTDREAGDLTVREDMRILQSAIHTCTDREAWDLTVREDMGILHQIRYTYLYWQGSRGSHCTGRHGDPTPDPLYVPVLTGKQGISLYGKTWGSSTRSAIHTCTDREAGDLTVGEHMGILQSTIHTCTDREAGDLTVGEDMGILHQICYTYLYWQGSRGSHCRGTHGDPTIHYTYLYWQGSRGSRCRGRHGDPTIHYTYLYWQGSRGSHCTGRHEDPPPDLLYIPVLTGKQGISL